MASVDQFIKKNIKQHLISHGLDEANANWCAEQGFLHYQRAVDNSKNPFNDACDYAGMMAEQRSLTFKYRAPKAKVKPRKKRPEEAFDFGGHQ